jgi:transposase
MSYTKYFRKKAHSIREKEKLTLKETAVRFGVGVASIMRWVKKIEPCTTRNRPASKINMEELKKDLQLHPDAFLYERAERLNVSQTCVFYEIRRLGVTYKKNSSSSERKQKKTGNF